jgi:hypothetical protein
MGRHPRLGAASPVLLLPRDLLKYIARFVPPDSGGHTVTNEALLRRVTQQQREQKEQRPFVGPKAVAGPSSLARDRAFFDDTGDWQPPAARPQLALACEMCKQSFDSVFALWTHEKMCPEYLLNQEEKKKKKKKKQQQRQQQEQQEGELVRLRLYPGSSALFSSRVFFYERADRPSRHLGYGAAQTAKVNASLLWFVEYLWSVARF